ncbi:hypothetical protein FJTKL_13845 [Diaporthe vaccinii]|uniref:Uncharacterized protein n=1 Tax=Diaporthe vaccinii TaxID=105482 RepID=A0ABR4F923_9PEZI
MISIPSSQRASQQARQAGGPHDGRLGLGKAIGWDFLWLSLAIPTPSRTTQKQLDDLKKPLQDINIIRLT